MLLTEKISLLVVHCSDTVNNQNLSAFDIHKMHLGFGWDGIGYHKIIKRSGKVENGRPEYTAGVAFIIQNSWTQFIEDRAIHRQQSNKYILLLQVGQPRNRTGQQPIQEKNCRSQFGSSSSAWPTHRRCCR